MDSESTAILSEAYQRLHRTGPEFGGDERGDNGLTNHGPMAVEVICRRGLEIDVHRWLDRYIRRLTDLPAAAEPITDATWRQALGGGQRRIVDWTAYFDGQLAERPWRCVLAAWWPRLLPGIAAGSTHGVIRVSHAVRTLLAAEPTRPAVAEIGYGLAFWAARFRVLPAVGAPRGCLPAAAALAAVPRLPDQNGLIASPARPACAAARLARRPARAAPARHGSRGTRAIGRTSRRRHHAVPDPRRGRPGAARAHRHRPQWRAAHPARAAAGVVGTQLHCRLDRRRGAHRRLCARRIARTPHRQALGGTNPVSDALARAARHGDEHVLKFTDTAVDVYRRTGNPGALAAAQHAAQLIDPP